jgi:hypothetical protein
MSIAIDCDDCPGKPNWFPIRLTGLTTVDSSRMAVPEDAMLHASTTTSPLLITIEVSALFKSQLRTRISIP